MKVFIESNSVNVIEIKMIKERKFAGGYISTSDDPSIVCQVTKKAKLFQISGQILSEKSVDEVKLYFAYDKPIFNEEDSIILGKTGEFFKELFYFNENIKYIRIDPLASEGKFEIKNLKIEGMDCIPSRYSGEINVVLRRIRDKIVQEKVALLINLILKKKLDPSKIIIINSHDMSNSGAPLLCKKISKKLKEMGYFTIILSQGKTIEAIDEHDYCEMLIYLDNVIEETTTIAEELSSLGVGKALFNTVVTGQVIEIFKKQNFKIISLIHEMKSSIQILKVESRIDLIADYADYILFPSECVKNDFEEFNSEIKGKALILPQGFYKENPGIVKSEENKNDLIKKLGLPINSVFLMGSGTITFGKGVDFIPLLLKKLIDYEESLGVVFQFVWLGELNKSDFSIWLYNQIEKMGLVDRIHFLGFMSDEQAYLRTLAAGEFFLLLSREDSFPSVLLESISVELPVIAFEKSGGASELLGDNCGFLMEYIDLDEVNKTIIESIRESKDYGNIIKNAKKKLESDYIFKEYVNSILGLLEE